jgi:hypothetical protein
MITKNRLVKILSLAVLINLAQPAQAMSWSWMTSLINQIKTGSSSILTKLQENKTLIGIAAIAGMGLLHLYAYAARKKTDTPVNQEPTSYIPTSANPNEQKQQQQDRNQAEAPQPPVTQDNDKQQKPAQEQQPQQDQTKTWNELVTKYITKHEQQPIVYTNGKRYIHETFSIYIPTQQILILVKQGKIYKFDAEKKKLSVAENKKRNDMIAFIKSKGISINETEGITITSWLEQINQEERSKAFAAQQVRQRSVENEEPKNISNNIVPSPQQQTPTVKQTAPTQQPQPHVESAAKPQKQHNAAYKQMMQGAKQLQQMNEERRKKEELVQEKDESFIEVEPTVQLDAPTVKRELKEHTKEANDILTKGIEVKEGLWTTKKIEFSQITKENVTLLEEHLNILKQVQKSLQASFEQGKQISLQVDRKDNSIYYQAETALKKLDQHIKLAEYQIQQVTKPQDRSLIDSFFQSDN